MAVSFTKNFSIQGTLQNKVRLINKALEGEMQNHIATIQQNVSQGRSYDGKKLKAYSKKYGARREKSGRNKSPVDLTITGSMMQSLDYKVEASNSSTFRGIIFFRNIDSISPKAFGGRSASAPDKAKWNLQKRKFFGISPQQVAELVRKVKLKI